jgi:pyrroloquinoline quinone (PQQ) biosynthesis protein C
MLEYFRSRVPRARRDSLEAIDFVVRHAATYEMQERCVAALIRKTQILWHLLDATYAAYVEPGWGPEGARGDGRAAGRTGAGAPASEASNPIHPGGPLR